MIDTQDTTVTHLVEIIKNLQAERDYLQTELKHSQIVNDCLREVMDVKATASNRKIAALRLEKEAWRHTAWRIAQQCAGVQLAPKKYVDEKHGIIRKIKISRDGTFLEMRDHRRHVVDDACLLQPTKQEEADGCQAINQNETRYFDDVAGW